MKSIIQWAIRNSPAMNTLLIASLIVGAISLVVMRREVFPAFALEIVLVSVPFPGATPEEVEEGICEKIESSLNGVDGIKKMTSVARENFGYMILELDGNVKDVQPILNEVRSRIDQISSFPPRAEDPDVRQIVFRATAIQVGILAPKESSLDSLTQERQLRELAEEIREEILELSPSKTAEPIRAVFAPLYMPTGAAVSSAEIVAERPYQIDVEIPEHNLQQYGLSLEGVARSIRLQNIETPGGKIESAGQEILLRGKNKRELGEEIARIPIASLPNGATLSVGDLGEVIDGFEDTDSDHLIDGRRGMVLAIARTSDEDLMTVVGTIKDYVATKQMPQGYELKTWGDISVEVQDRIDMLTRNGTQGLILVFIVLAIFLEMRLAFWVAIGIPVAILGAGFVLLFTGQTLNMLTMFSFLMALGIVVDDAIVIGENIYTKRQQGLNPFKAAVEGTCEVLPSVAASVTTTIIAFMPLMFVTGVMGKFIAVMPLAVIAMLVISLVESMLILPCHLAHENNLFLRMLSVVFYVLRPLLYVFEKINAAAAAAMAWAIEKFYRPFLSVCLGNRRITISTAIAIFVLATGLIFSGIVPFEAFPKIDGRTLSATVAFPAGTSSEVTHRAAAFMEKAIQEVDAEIEEEYGNSVVQSVYRRVGEVGDMFSGPTGVTDGSHVASVEVQLVTSAQRKLTSDQINNLWRQRVGEIEGTEVLSYGTSSMGPGGKKIEFKLLASADSVKVLEEATERCKQYLAGKEGVYDIEDDSRIGKWEMLLKLNELGRALGMDETALASAIRSGYYGEEVMRLQRGRHEVKLMVRYPEADRKDADSIRKIRIRDSEGVERPLSDVADVKVQRAYSEINRLNQKRSITITADVNQEESNAFEIVAEMRNTFIPQLIDEYNQQGYNLFVDWEGEQQQTMESFSSMFVGFFIAMICMYVLLTLAFRSYVQPAIILAIIPFGMVGAVLGHWILGLSLTLFSFFGLIALTGVVVNDSIVLVDFINRRVAEGWSVRDAVLKAGMRRFRPIMLTSVTTIAGLTPILFETSFQAQVLIPMAASLVFGLATGTMLILILVPVFYDCYGHLASWVGGSIGDRHGGTHDLDENPVENDPETPALNPVPVARDVGPAVS